MLSHRLQILLDEGRFRRLAREADRRHTSVAAVIRDAIDEVLPAAHDVRRRGAVAAILAAPAMPVPADPGDLRRETDAGRSVVDA
jgi:hypothetical protein